jgi:release factor glutamine methyltransferase
LYKNTPLPTIGGLLAEAERRLSDTRDTARLDAEVLLCHALGADRARLYAGKHETVSGETRAFYLELIERRADGVPVAYLTGQREFWSLPLEVNEHTLIPRPETEHLVEAAIGLIRAEGLRLVADLGTGTGAIALAIAQECLHQPPPPARGKERVRIVATDISAEALGVAQKNAKLLGLSDIDFRLGDWCEALAGEQFDLIVSNPPYVAVEDPYLQQGALRFEPCLALASGPDGFDAIRRILADAGTHLRKDGWLALEHGFEQREGLCGLLEAHWFEPIETLRDYGGRERVTISRLRQ